MSAYSPTELEALVRQRAPEIARDLQRVAQQARNEADLVAEAEKVLERFAQNFDVQLHPERERTLVNGRADAVYNRLVIEYEPPGSLRASNVHGHNRHAIQQVKDYMDGLERLDRHRKERLAGVVLDGSYYIFIRYRDTRWRVDDPVQVATQSTETFLRYLLALSTELALTPENLVRDFGENSNVARQVVPVLYKALPDAGSGRVGALFRQWRRQFREVTGYDPTTEHLDLARVARLYAIRDRSLDAERLFFSIHTYYAAFIKLLALQVTHYYLMPKVGTGLVAVASYESEGLHSYLAELERGGIFAQLGIRNFLEGDFFGWYLDVWDESLDRALRRLIADLGNYSLVTLDVDPEETRDLLKNLYEDLMPKQLRHALGEYYTPDWLADRLLNQLGYKGDPRERLLDPACGSGTFLILAIRRVRQYGGEKMLPPARMLEQVLQNVVGFDLNPLAVISARANYLLALGDLLSHRQGDISIPVYLADSILTPSADAAESGQLTFLDKRSGLISSGYSFNTAVGRFTVPRTLADANYLDQFAHLLEESVHIDLAPDQFRMRLLEAFPLREDEDDADISVAVDLYGQLLQLERQGMDGIWARIIKNAFAPLFQGRFDYVAGNPPWVNWESLPTGYRQETAPLWTMHNLFPHKGYEAILGKAKDDISVLLTYIALDKYLRDGGRLGFVITQSVFKTAGGGRGFRRFELGDGTPIQVLAVDDLTDIKPFEGASNRTAVVVLQRGARTKYPVAYNLWRKLTKGRRVPQNSALAEALSMCTIFQMAAQPIDRLDLASSWITGRPRALRASQNVLGPSHYRAYEGSNTGGGNGIYWLKILSRAPDGSVIVSNLTEGARVRVEDVQAVIEPNLIYPLLRGRDLERWKGAPSAHVLVPHEPGMRLRAVPEDEMGLLWPKTYAYFKRFELVLRQRAAYRRYFKPTDPFYSMFNVGDYTFSPHKVVWREQASSLTAAVVSGDRPCVVPDHKLMLVPFEDEREAHYVCAALNSAPARFLVLSYAVNIQMNTHILTRVGVPVFDPASDVHCRLAELSVSAHAAAASGEAKSVGQLEDEIDQVAAALWGLSLQDLSQIRESLAELTGVQSAEQTPIAL